MNAVAPESMTGFRLLSLKVVGSKVKVTELFSKNIFELTWMLFGGSANLGKMMSKCGRSKSCPNQMVKKGRGIHSVSPLSSV